MNGCTDLNEYQLISDETKINQVLDLTASSTRSLYFARSSLQKHEKQF